MRRRDSKTTRSSMRAAKKDPAKNLPPHESRALYDELMESLLKPKEEEKEKPWSCPLRVVNCKEEKTHRAHADPEALLKRSRPLKREVLEAVVARPSEEAYRLLLQRPDVGGKYREQLIALACSPATWDMVLDNVRSLEELRLLAKRKAPSEESCRRLMHALEGDIRGGVEQLFQERRYHQLMVTYGQTDNADFRKAILEEGGEFIQVANAVMNLPCPSGNWTPALVIGTVKKLLSRLPTGPEREACAEIIVGLAINWEGSVADLVSASELLTF